jgi:hypothetical protein
MCVYICVCVCAVNVKGICGYVCLKGKRHTPFSLCCRFVGNHQLYALDMNIMVEVSSFSIYESCVHVM